MDTLRQIIEKPLGNHGHISDFNSDQELTVCVYDEENLDSSFHERIRTLIIENR